MEGSWNAFGISPLVWLIIGVLLYLALLLLSRMLRAWRRAPPALRVVGALVAVVVMAAVIVLVAGPMAGALADALRSLLDQAKRPERWRDAAFLALWVGAGLTLGPWLVALVLPNGAFARTVRPGVAMGSFALGTILFVLFETPIRHAVNQLMTGGGKLGLLGTVTLELGSVADRSARASFTLRPGEPDQTGGALATAAHELALMTQHGGAPTKDGFSHLSLIERDFRILSLSPLMSVLEKHLRVRARGDLRLLIGLTPAFACLHAFASENGDRALLSPAIAPFLNALVALVESGAAASPPVAARWVGRPAPAVRDLAWGASPEPMEGEPLRMSNARRVFELQRAGLTLVQQLGLLTRASARLDDNPDHDGRSGCSHAVSLLQVKEEDLPYLNVTPYPAIAAAELFAAIGMAEQGVAILDRWIARRDAAAPPSQLTIDLAWWPIRARIERAVLMDRAPPATFPSEQRSFLLHELTARISQRFDNRQAAAGRPEDDASDALCEAILANRRIAQRPARQWVAFTHATLRSRAFSLVVPSDDMAQLEKWLGEAEEIIRNAEAGCFDGLQRFEQARDAWLALFELDRLWLRAINLFRPDIRVADAEERSRNVVTLLADARATEQRLAIFIRASSAGQGTQTVNWCAHLDRAMGLANAIQNMTADISALARSQAATRATRQQCLQRRVPGTGRPE